MPSKLERCALSSANWSAKGTAIELLELADRRWVRPDVPLRAWLIERRRLGLIDAKTSASISRLSASVVRTSMGVSRHVLPERNARNSNGSASRLPIWLGGSDASARRSRRRARVCPGFTRSSSPAAELDPGPRLVRPRSWLPAHRWPAWSPDGRLSRSRLRRCRHRARAPAIVMLVDTSGRTPWPPLVHLGRRRRRGCFAGDAAYAPSLMLQDAVDGVAPDDDSAAYLRRMQQVVSDARRCLRPSYIPRLDDSPNAAVPSPLAVSTTESGPASTARTTLGSDADGVDRR